MKTGPLFEPLMREVNQPSSPVNITVSQGGSASGKTYTTLQVLLTLCMQNPGRVATVVAQDVPNLKRGAYRDAKRIREQNPEIQAWFPVVNESDRLFKCVNGSVIEFTAFSDEQDARGARRDYLFVNECNSIPYLMFYQLYTRTRLHTWLDYNPSSRFWVHDKLLGRPNVELLISDHRQNPFLDPAQHELIERTADPALWRVYARGLTGQFIGQIYKNWFVCYTMPSVFSREWYGVDFGFTNDPTAIVRVRMAEGELWVEQLAYRTGMSNRDIVQVLAENGVSRNSLIVADSAEPKSIAEIYNLGYRRITPASKGADSITNGIAKLQSYKINVTEGSKELRTELERYSWAFDRAGQPVNRPVDKYNHALDALRYVALNYLGAQPQRRAARAYTTTY